MYLSDRVYADMVSDGFVFYLDPSLSYRVIFHDPKFYHIVSNTLTFPRIWRDISRLCSYWSSSYITALCGISL